MAQQPMSRNAPCRCGSGKKFKRCCHPRESLLRADCLPRSCGGGNQRPRTIPPTTPSSQSTPPRNRDWRQIHVMLRDEQGRRVYLAVVHSSEWLRTHKVAQGGTVFVNLPTEGVRGEGRVTRIEPSPLVPDGEGRVTDLVVHYRAGESETVAAGRQRDAAEEEPVTPDGQGAGRPAWLKVGEAGLRVFQLHLEKPGGGWVDVGLLRPVGRQQAIAGGRVSGRDR